MKINIMAEISYDLDLSLLKELTGEDLLESYVIKHCKETVEKLLEEELTGDQDGIVTNLTIKVEAYSGNNVPKERLAVNKGSCPFPASCNKRKTCTKDYCNADTCTDGTAFRWS